LIVDTSALLAFYIPRDPRHAAVRDLLSKASDDLTVSPYVVAEVDYLVLTREGVRSELAVLRDLTSGAWDLVEFEQEDLRTAIDVIDKYSDHEIGLADASNVVLASRYSTRTIATLDHKHYSMLRPLRGGRFSIVP
jgi:uncharacterized protein